MLKQPEIVNTSLSVLYISFCAILFHLISLVTWAHNPKVIGSSPTPATPLKPLSAPSSLGQGGIIF
jgi:hypothetical protein